MADIRITALPALAAALASDVLAIEDIATGVTKKITIANLFQDIPVIVTCSESIGVGANKGFTGIAAGPVTAQLIGINATTDVIQIGHSTLTSDVTFFNKNGFAMVIANNGTVGIGVSSPTSTYGGLDIASGGLSLIVGAENDSIARTDATSKRMRLGLPHHINAEEPMALLFGYIDGSTSEVDIGGGTSMNAPTFIKFFTAGNTTTVAGTEAARFDTSQRLIIGHTASQIMDGYIPRLQVNHDSQAAIGVAAFTADAVGCGLVLAKSRNGTIGSHTILQDNDVIGNIMFAPSDGVDFANTAVRLRAEVDDASPAANDIGGAFTISTHPGGGGSLTERLRIAADGNVGIGGVAPSNFFDVYSTSASLEVAKFTNAGAGGQKVYIAGNTGDAFVHFGVSVRNWSIGIDNSDSDTFKIDDGIIPGSLTRLSIDASGIISMPAVYSHDMNGETYRDLLINNSGELGYDSSTIRAKTNVQDLEDVSWLHSLRPITFNPKANTSMTRIGLIAEEVEQIKPDMVFHDVLDDGTKQVAGVHYREMITPLIAEIQNLRKELEALKVTIH